MTKLPDRWLRRWSDEHGEAETIERRLGEYVRKYRTPAWEPRAGEVHYSRITLADARAYDPDPLGEEYEYHDNEQARMENDPFFAV